MHTELIKEISTEILKTKLDANESIQIVDVREDYELEISQFSSFIHMPLGDLSERIEELNKKDEIIVVCRTGNRSARATEFLSENGFKFVYNLVGGINQWAEDIDQGMAVY